MLIYSKFNGRCKRCGGAFGVGDALDWSKATGAYHFKPSDCQAVQAAPAPVAIDVAPIVALLQGAKDWGLVWPKARFLGPASKPGPLDGRQELRLSLAPATGKNPGAVYVKLADEYQGLVAPDGSVRGTLAGDVELRALLATIAAEPARLAREYGAVTCACSFCNLALTDEGSIDVGYGPICADRYGLPHTAKGSRKLRALDAGLFPEVQA